MGKHLIERTRCEHCGMEKETVAQIEVPAVAPAPPREISPIERALGVAPGTPVEDKTCEHCGSQVKVIKPAVLTETATAPAPAAAAAAPTPAAEPGTEPRRRG
jgi:hypothetical protein